jgi:periplasmic copper chaperone A
MRILSFLLVGLAFAAGAAAGPITAGDLLIGEAYAFDTPPLARSGAGYLTITNRGEAPDTLLEVDADGLDAMVHRTETDATGMTAMTHAAAGLTIPPGGTLVLEPGAGHVMFMGLTGPLVAGETLDATLRFERAGEVPVRFTVVPRSGDHAGH